MYKIAVTPNNSEIEYKTIRPEDFPGYNVKDNSYSTIIADENGFISDFLIKEIDIEHKDTTVINASVGQGKTTALIKIAKEYYNKKDYMVFIVAPAKSLLDQYILHLKKTAVPQHDILDYRELEFMTIEDDKEKFAERKFQVMTFNFLLANSGDRYLKQADHKAEYIDEILQQCVDNNRKVVIIFDEIHDAIHNFKEDLVFNLFRWRNHIHKIFVSSATFNEASKVVIKYFAELTDQKIMILESPRIQDNAANDLSILVYDRASYDVNDPNLIGFFKKEIGKAKKINILTYSKFLADKISSSTIGSLLKKSYGEINVCTGDTDTLFDEKKCNIGTTFKTGISINEEDTAFYIFLPPKNAYYKTPPTLGIFSDGINSLIQGLARVRKKGRIYVITPDKTNEFDIPDRRFPKTNALLKLKDQDFLLEQFYQDLKDKLQAEIDFLSSESTLIKASFPDYNQFKLSKGEIFFRTYFDIFGRNMTNYFNWASSNNQFVNCKLKDVYRIDLQLNEKELILGILEYFKKVFIGNSTFYYSSTFNQYHQLRKSIFSNHVTIVKKPGTILEVKEFESITLEKSIIKFIQVLNHNLPYLENDLGTNHGTPQAILKDRESLKWLETFKLRALKNYVKVNDPTYFMSTEEYIRNAVYWSVKTSIMKDSISTEEKALVDLYSDLSRFKTIFKKYFDAHNVNLIIPNDKDFIFEKGDFENLCKLFEKLIKSDEILGKVFAPFRNGITHSNLFSLLKKVFFDVGLTNISGKRAKIIKADHDYDEVGINLIYSEKDLFTILNESPQFYEYPKD